LIEVQEDAQGNLDPRTLVRHEAGHFGLQEPQGMTIDPASGHLFILDSAAARIIRVEPEGDGTFDRAVVTAIDLQPTGLAAVRGLAFDPTTGHLHLLSLPEQTLVEVSQSGQVVATRALAAFGLRQPQGMVFAPSGDLTDAASEISLYISEGQTPGDILEFSFAEPVAPVASAITASLVRTIDTSQWSPPSPDPSGLAYLPASGTLLVADGEVNEMPPYFTGKNLFEASLSGTLLKTLTTISFSDEPVGLDVNPANKHLFISDDTGTRSVYELNPGPDGLYNTSDDTFTSFKTADFGSSDPEGLAYDAGSGALFIIDGVNREVYRVTPGPNGIFNGVPPVGDDQVTHFDTANLGLDDPEGIAFNSNSGTLYAVGKPADTLFELTTGGNLVQTIDISAADATKPAGVAYGPGSQNAGQMSIYIAARGVDNDSNPNENDGKLYEFSLGQPVVTPTPTSTPTPDALDLIFADNFESGNLSAWSSSTTDGGDLTVNTAAALVGGSGLQAVIDDNVSIFVTDDTPNAEPRYRARFYFDPNSIPMANGNAHFLFEGFVGTSTKVLQVEFRRSSGNYQLRARLLNDSTTWTNTNWFTITDGSHFVEVDWRAATAAGANNGSLTLWLDGIQKANLTGVNNDTRRIDRIRLGAVAGIDTGTRGTYYFDTFESRRQTYIGPAPDGSPTPTPTPTATRGPRLDS
jgi:uncharacterized protein YjiK